MKTEKLEVLPAFLVEGYITTKEKQKRCKITEGDFGFKRLYEGDNVTLVYKKLDKPLPQSE